MYCHKRKIIHRDLKPHNMLLDKDYNIKVTDYGLSNYENCYGDNKLKTKLGTKGYAPPEMYIDRDYLPEPCDVFTLGIILYVMVAQLLPWKEAKKNNQDFVVFKNKPKVFWGVQENK